ncbi:hypothetical protein HMPREF1986_02503 [Oribacterium sp. oral taxon 078 str. F0263]|nr:hypothetical protein HMPREF1986_02503 [Oribacterium sp. oral taxon 078 str. F0263]
MLSLRPRFPASRKQFKNRISESRCKRWPAFSKSEAQKTRIHNAAPKFRLRESQETYL